MEGDGEGIEMVKGERWRREGDGEGDGEGRKMAEGGRQWREGRKEGGRREERGMVRQRWQDYAEALKPRQSLLCMCSQH